MNKNRLTPILLAMMVITLFSVAARSEYQKIDVDPDLFYRGIFKYEDRYLIKAEKYFYPESRYINYFLDYQSPKDSLIILEGYETTDMAENENAYFALVRKKYEVLLLKRDKTGDKKWKKLKRTYELPSNPMDLEVLGERVLIVTPKSIYHNFRRSKVFDEWMAPEVDSGAYGFNVFLKKILWSGLLRTGY